MRRQIRHGKRYLEILRILKKYGFGDLVSRSGIEKAVDFGRNGVVPEVEASASTGDAWKRIRCIFEELGPAYIKFAQLLCFRGDLVPLDLVTELEKLSDEVPPFPAEDARAVIEKELEAEIDEIFLEFHDIPVAAGSVAQVHRAVLQTGETVAVKIQRPGVLKQVRTDIEIMQNMAEIVCRRIPEMQVYNLKTILDEFSKTIEMELDFLHEAAHMESFASIYAEMEEIHVPYCFRRYCTRKVLTMEFIDGIKISETQQLRDEGYDLKLLARRGVDVILRHIFEEGYFHADPHAGNLVVMKDSRLCFLDYGMMGRLSPPTKRLMNSMLIGAVLKDSEYITKHILRLCETRGDVNQRQIEVAAAEILDFLFSTSLESVDTSEVIKKMIRVFPEQGLVLPADLYLLGRAIILFHNNGGIRLDPEFNIAKYVIPYVEKSVRERFKISKILKDSAIAVEEISEFSKNMPFEISDILSKAKHGRMGFRLTLEGLASAQHAVERSANRLSFALIIASIVLGSSMILGPECQQTLFGLPSLCIVGFILAGVFGVLLLISIIRHGRM